MLVESIIHTVLWGETPKSTTACNSTRITREKHKPGDSDSTPGSKRLVTQGDSPASGHQRWGFKSMLDPSTLIAFRTIYGQYIYANENATLLYNVTTDLYSSLIPERILLPSKYGSKHTYLTSLFLMCLVAPLSVMAYVWSIMSEASKSLFLSSCKRQRVEIRIESIEHLCTSAREQK